MEEAVEAVYGVTWTRVSVQDSYREGRLGRKLQETVLESRESVPFRRWMVGFYREATLMKY